MIASLILNIKFVFELDRYGNIPFLDVLLMRRNGKLEATGFR